MGAGLRLPCRPGSRGHYCVGVSVNTAMDAPDTATPANNPDVASAPVPGFRILAKDYKLCPSGHVVGARYKDGSVVRLLLFRVAMPALPTGIAVPHANILGAIDSSPWLYCSQCGAMFDWKPGSDFLRNVKDRQK